MIRQIVRRSMLLSLTVLLIESVTAQEFTRITEGSIVNDGGESEACAWGDYDGDGDLDLFVSNGLFNSQKNFLYRNDGPESGYTFTKITEGDIVNDVAGSRAASWGDYDKDSDLDLFVANQSGNPNNNLYQNNGDGTFTAIIEGAIVNDGGTSDPAGWVDYDNDDNLDIFVGNIGEVNFLYHNEGDGSFVRVTEGSIVTDREQTIGHSWGDYDNDGDADLFIANRGRNSIYQNDGGGTFAKLSEGTIVDEVGTSGGGNWVDYDNDGDLDLFVSVNGTSQPNSLYRNEGSAQGYAFTRIEEGSIVTDVSTYSYSNWADFDNDGDLDLFVSNFGTTDLQGQVNFLYENNGDGTFTRIMEGDVATDVSTSVGGCWADYDNDGDLDLFVCNTISLNNALYRNDLTDQNNWLQIRLTGVTSNTAGIGARVSVRSTQGAASSWQMRVIEGLSGPLGQNSLIAHFGLGSASSVDTLRIEWPSEVVDIYTGLEINRIVDKREGDGTVAEESDDDLAFVPRYATLLQNYPNPFNSSTTISYVLQRPAMVVLRIYNVFGQEIRSLVRANESPGTSTVVWDGTDAGGHEVSSGVYFYRLEAGPASLTRKMLLVR